VQHVRPRVTGTMRGINAKRRGIGLSQKVKRQNGISREDSIPTRPENSLCVLILWSRRNVIEAIQAAPDARKTSTVRQLPELHNRHLGLDCILCRDIAILVQTDLGNHPANLARFQRQLRLQRPPSASQRRDRPPISRIARA